MSAQTVTDAEAGTPAEFAAWLRAEAATKRLEGVTMQAAAAELITRADRLEAIADTYPTD